ncbi:MAG: group 1 glycosyl transferase [Frankiales bacterium]|nr:group 1 glycosyl transferase [Frankiales bacterium]
MPPHLLRVAILSWRDSTHPEGGGSEQYAEAMAAGLAERGHSVTILTARHPGSTKQEAREGYLIRRAGGRFTVYLRALVRILTGPRFDVIVDVQNGTPFFARLVTRRPVVVLCHHVHRDQWRIALGNTWVGRRIATVGWWVESWLAPRILRGCRYVTVSEVSRRDLIGLGVTAADITVVHNGTPAPLPGVARSEVPEIVVLGRLVPHKRVEHAVRAVAALSDEMPDLRLTVVGHGWWSDEVATEVARLGLTDRVELVGHVTEARKHELLSRAWVLATPSVMEGWGLCVVEAASHGTPSVAYRSAGGLTESVLHGVTGLLAEDDEQAFTAALRELLTDEVLRHRFGLDARRHAKQFAQEASVDAFVRVLQKTQGIDLPLRLPGGLPLPRPSHELPQPVTR